MNVRFWILLAAAACAFVAVVIGFGWFGFDEPGDRADWGGWAALSWLLFFVAHLIVERPFNRDGG